MILLADSVSCSSLVGDLDEKICIVEVTKFEDVDKCGSQGAAKEAGLMKLEGKDYIVQDGDVILFRTGK